MIILKLLIVFSLLTRDDAFHVERISKRARTFRSHLCVKKKNKNTSGQGFGKEVLPSTPPKKKNSDDNYTGLQTIEKGGSDEIPKFDYNVSQDNLVPKLNLDKSLPPQERAEQILRQKYGLQSPEERLREKAKKEQAKKMEELREMAEDENFDIISIIPPPLLVFIDRFLKGGLTVSTILFVTAGVAITAEAYSKASQNPLPENIDSFIVNVIEPNFTPGLFVLLAFSVSLGAFAALQLSSTGSQYREDS